MSGLAALGSIASGMLTNAANAQMNANQIALTRELWEKEKAWNSPDAQVKRLRAAAINPALAMNNGMLGNGETKAPPLPSMQPYDFSPIAQGIRDSVELYQQKRLQDSQIDNTNADTLSKNIRNKWENTKIALEILDMAKKPDKTQAETDFLSAQAKGILKENDWIDEKNSSMVALNRAESQERINQAAVHALQAKWQQIINQYAGKIESAKLQQILAQADAALAAANSSNSEADINKVVKRIKEIDERVAEGSADALVDAAFGVAEERYWNWQNSAKEYQFGKLGINMPSKRDDSGNTYLSPERPSNARRHAPRKR